MSERLLVLVRHGQSDWNLKNLFTGWKDPDLTELGVSEAKAAGQRLKALGLTFDTAYTSGAHPRAEHAEPHPDRTRPDQPACRKGPGAERARLRRPLSGLNKDDARKKWGEDQVHLWRRSYDVPPPGGESLKDTVARVLPYYNQHILPCGLARRARDRRRARQFAARSGDGARRPDPGDHPQHGAGDRRAAGLSPQGQFDCGDRSRFWSR